MTAYATAERFPGVPPHPVAHVSHVSTSPLRPSDVLDAGGLDVLLARLADLVTDRLAERFAAAPVESVEHWMDARSAAEYLGVHRDTIRKLAAERAIPVHQDGPGCKLFFRRDELDDWRRSSKTPRWRLRAVS